VEEGGGGAEVGGEGEGRADVQGGEDVGESEDADDDGEETEGSVGGSRKDGDGGAGEEPGRERERGRQRETFRRRNDEAAAEAARVQARAEEAEEAAREARIDAQAAAALVVCYYCCGPALALHPSPQPLLPTLALSRAASPGAHSRRLPCVYYRSTLQDPFESSRREIAARQAALMDTAWRESEVRMGVGGQHTLSLHRHALNPKPQTAGETADGAGGPLRRRRCCLCLCCHVYHPIQCAEHVVQVRGCGNQGMM